MIGSLAIIEEVRAVLHFLRIRKKYPLDDEEIEGRIALLKHDALLVVGESNVAGSVPDDPKDEMFLAFTLDGQADIIVSG